MISATSDSTCLQEMCSELVRHLRHLGYPHADNSTCERMLRAFFPYEPTLVEGSADTAAAAAFLARFLDQCKQRARETAVPRARRCYGQAVEEAMLDVGASGGRAPRLTELMTQLDADGHDTARLRTELESLVDALGMTHFYRN